MEVRGLTPILNVSDIDVVWPPTDEPWNVREFHLRHPDGHTFRVSSGLPEA